MREPKVLHFTQSAKSADGLHRVGNNKVATACGKTVSILAITIHLYMSGSGSRNES
jgi:hypothetical protein